jgi:glycosyltransferase domain-containing protein
MMNDLTIILLLKGRDAFTIRWFEYAKKFKLSCKVIVADGGVDNGVENELRNNKFHLFVNYDYVRYPYDKNLKIFYAKLQDALMKVETQYVLLASNDDFYFFDALESSVHFLNENPEFVTSRGEIWDFNVISSPSGFKISNDKDHVYGDLGSVKRLYFHPTVLGDSAMDRVVDYSLKSHSVFHDVIRTKNLKEACGALVKSKINDIRFFESFIAFFISCHGKIHRGRELHMFHQCHPEMAALTVIGDTPHEWIDSAGWNEDLDRLFNSIAGQISKIDKITFQEAKCEFMECYLVNVILKTMMRGESSQGITQISIKAQTVSLIKSIIKKNGVILYTAKKIYSMFLVRKQDYFPFEKELEDVKNFLKTEK